MDRKFRPLIRTAAIATALQLAAIALYTVTAIYTGPRPANAAEAFEAFRRGALYGLMKDELLLVVMLSLYLINFSALYFILREHRFTLAFFGAFFSFIAVILSMATHSGFSLMHLARIYDSASDEALKNRLLAAGEAVIAGNLWNGTSSYFSGFLLQGGGVLICLAMVGSGKFSPVTIVTGILSNGLDLIQHAIHLAVPAPAEIILRIAGLFYLVWYIALAIDLFRFRDYRE